MGCDSTAAEPLEQPSVIQHLYRPSLESKGFGEAGGVGQSLKHDGLDAGEPKLAPWQYSRRTNPSRQPRLSSEFSREFRFLEVSRGI